MAAMSKRYLPLYEAKMIHHFDHRWATYEVLREAKGKKKVGEPVTRLVAPEEKADPNFVVLPRYWVAEEEVEARAKSKSRWLLGWRDICRSTDERTAVFSVFPRTGVGHQLPLAIAATSPAAVGSMMACTAGLVFDYVCRQKMGGTHLTYFYLKQLPMLVSSHFGSACEWSWPDSHAVWLLPRILELTYTAYDLTPFARDLGYEGEPFRWDDERRFWLRAELDAAFFHLYLPCTPDGDWQKAERETEEELNRLKSLFPTPRHAVDYVLDTFPIVRRKDIEKYGTYRTKEVILQVYDAMLEAIRTGEPYRSPLNPPPSNGWTPSEGQVPRE